MNVFAFAVGPARDVPDLRGLPNGYGKRTKAEALGALAAGRVKAFEANARRHKRKARLWQVSLAVGVTLMVLSVVVHTDYYDNTAPPGRSGGVSTASAQASRA